MGITKKLIFFKKITQDSNNNKKIKSYFFDKVFI
jgi:hypothetical protein